MHTYTQMHIHVYMCAGIKISAEHTKATLPGVHNVFSQHRMCSFAIECVFLL